MLISFLMGFSSGLPLALTGSTMQAWLTVAKMDIKTIGFFALVGLPYTTKFLWAPILDNVRLPFLGLRRGWLALSQVGLFGATIGLAMSDPVANLSHFVVMALLVALFSSTQDVVVDAFRTEIIDDKDEVGAGAASYVIGYRISWIGFGGLAMVMADHMSWQNVYFIMALVNLVGLATTLMSAEPKIKRVTEKFNFAAMVSRPFVEFFQRVGAMEILLFIMVYKLSTIMATSLTTNFLLSLGYSQTIIGTTNKAAGLAGTILGAFVGGALMYRIGLKKSLWFFGVIQSLVGIMFCILARLSGTEELMKQFWLVTIVTLDNFMMGLGTAALTGFMMSFVSKQFTGAQYAILTSVMAVGRVILAAQAGVLQEQMGWDWFFIATVPLAIPGLLLLIQFDSWQTHAAKSAARISTANWLLIGLFMISLLSLSAQPVLNWLGMPDVGKQVEKFGSIGIVIVVMVGVVRPHLTWGKAARLKAAA
jgi:PAT family beta-lactamase induction signal transducer AmpG